jgi:hypothetical protein
MSAFDTARRSVTVAILGQFAEPDLPILDKEDQ